MSVRRAKVGRALEREDGRRLGEGREGENGGIGDACCDGWSEMGL